MGGLLITKLEGQSLCSANCDWDLEKNLLKWNDKVYNVKRHPSMKPSINLRKIFPFLSYIFIL